MTPQSRSPSPRRSADGTKRADDAAFLTVLDGLKRRRQGDDMTATPVPTTPVPTTPASTTPWAARRPDAAHLVETIKLNQEIARLNADIRKSDRRLFETQTRLAEVERQRDKLQGTISFRLGNAAIAAGRSWSGAARFPGIACRLFLEARRRRLTAASPATPETGAKPAKAMKTIDTAMALLRDKGSAAAAAWARSQRLQKPALGRVLVEIANAAKTGEPDVAVALAVEAIRLDPAQYRVTHLAFVMADLGYRAEAATVIDAVFASDAVLHASERRRMEGVLTDARAAVRGPSVQSAPPAGNAIAGVGAVFERLMRAGRSWPVATPLALARRDQGDSAPGAS